MVKRILAKEIYRRAKPKVKEIYRRVKPTIKRVAETIERKRLAGVKFMKASSLAPISSKKTRLTRTIHTPLGIITKEIITKRIGEKRIVNKKIQEKWITGKAKYYLELPKRKIIPIKASPKLKQIISSQFGQKVRRLKRSEKEYLIRRLQIRLKQKKLPLKPKPTPTKKIALKTQIKKATNINKIIRSLPF